jgi:penicillin-binding protein 1A
VVAEEARKKAEEAAQAGLPVFERPRLLSTATSRLLKDLGEKMKTAPALKAPETVAEAG